VSRRGHRAGDLGGVFKMNSKGQLTADKVGTVPHGQPVVRIICRAAGHDLIAARVIVLANCADACSEGPAPPTPRSAEPCSVVVEFFRAVTC